MSNYHIYSNKENDITPKTTNCMPPRTPRKDELFYIEHLDPARDVCIKSPNIEMETRNPMLYAEFASNMKSNTRIVKKSVQYDGNLYEYNSSDDDLVKITNKFGSIWIPRTELKKMISFLIMADRDLENV